MNRNQLKSFIRKTINEQGFYSSFQKKQNKRSVEISNWIKKNGIDQLPMTIENHIIDLIIKNYFNLPIGLQKIIDKYK